MHFPFDPEIVLLEIYPKAIPPKIHVQEIIHSRLFVTAKYSSNLNPENQKRDQINYGTFTHRSTMEIEKGNEKDFYELRWSIFQDNIVK